MVRTSKVITVTMNTAIDRLLNVPGFTVGGHLKADSVGDTPAGKGVNVSRTFAELGWASTTTGFVGQADNQLYIDSLESFSSQVMGRVDCQLVPVEGSTRRNLTILNPDDGTDTHLRLPGFQVKAKDIARLMQVLRETAGPDALVVFSGSRPAGMDMAALLELIGTVEHTGARIALDLNGPDLQAALTHLHYIWLISPNRQEITQALGLNADLPLEDLIRAARELPNRVEHVLLSLGREGSVLVTPKQSIRGTTKVEPDRIVHTVGAGDSLLAGVIDGLLDESNSPEKALSWGMGVVAYKLTHSEPMDIDVVSPCCDGVTCEVIDHAQ